MNAQADSRLGRTADRGMLVLEQKLSILAQGPSRTRRNPALDVLTGRVPDERLQSLQTSLLSTRQGTSQEAGPSAMVLPVAAIRMAAVARSTRPSPSPWLKPANGERPLLKLIMPPPSPWVRLPLIGLLILWFMAAYRPYRPTARSPRARLAS